jgi:hypothetical protein
MQVVGRPAVVLQEHLRGEGKGEPHRGEDDPADTPPRIVAVRNDLAQPDGPSIEARRPARILNLSLS